MIGEPGHPAGQDTWSETDLATGPSQAWLIWRVVLLLIEQAAGPFLARQQRVEDRHLQDDASVVGPALRAEEAD